MKIVLIDVNASRSLGGGFSAGGSRLISALLKRAGHSVKLAFLVKPNPLTYSQDDIERLQEIVKDVDLVMISVYSACASVAIRITEFVHKKYPGMKVIWGGPHCIAAPELSLRYADGVCFCEGDICVVEFVNKLEANDKDYLKTANMAFKVNGTNVVNEVLPPFEDLDSLPFLDYNFEGQYLLNEGLFPISEDILKDRFMAYPFFRPTFVMVTSRGCPHQCSYCNNCRYVDMFGKNYIRFQGIGRFMDELEINLNHLDFFEWVHFADDDFFLRSTKQLEEFAVRYKRNIGIPFMVNVSANTYRKEKMEILTEAGLKCIQMGVQSASQRVLDEVYNRNIKVTKTRDAVLQIEPYTRTHGISFLLDFIIDNPYETRSDIIQTYRYISRLPKKAQTNIFCLVFSPGTPIYDRAVNDGITEPYDAKASRSFADWNRGHILYQKNYETFLIIFTSRLRRYIPRPILYILGSSPVRGIASILPKALYAFSIRAYLNYLFPILHRLRQIVKS